MATWIVLLRSRLLIPVGPSALLNAEAEAETLQARLLALQEMQSLAAWLSARPQLGQDVFARGVPEMLGALAETDHQVDVIEFLRATVELLDDGARIHSGFLGRLIRVAIQPSGPRRPLNRHHPVTRPVYGVRAFDRLHPAGHIYEALGLGGVVGSKRFFCHGCHLECGLHIKTVNGLKRKVYTDVNRHAKGPPYRRPKRPRSGGPLLRVVGGRWWCSGADGAVGKWPAGATVGRVRRRRATYPQRRREVVVLRCRVQARCLKRQLSLPVSTMSQWWVRRSSRAAVILASPNTLGQSPNARFVVTIIEVCS